MSIQHERARPASRDSTIDKTPDDIPVAEQLLLDIIDTVREPLLVLDASFRVMHANRAFLRTFQVEAEDTIGQLLFSLGDGQWDIAALHDRLNEKVLAEQQLLDFDVDHMFPGIGRRIMVLNARLVSHGPGGPRIILLAFEDVTERRFTETRLAAQRIELQRSNDALNEFAAIASHDLQEPLRKILAFGERLGLAAGPTLSDEGRQHLDRMLSAATRMRTLIGDLLAYSQVSTRAPRVAQVDLGQVAREVTADLETSIAESGGRVEVGPLPTIQGDALEMRQLLQNLVGNALKYRRPGTPPVVDIRCVNPLGPRCTITVRDNGIGFDQAYAERIFKMFARLHGRNQYAGTGIGLAICKQIVERHGGSITAAGTNGEGAVFAITLPVTQPTSTRSK